MKDLYAASNQNDLASFGIAYRNFVSSSKLNQIYFYPLFLNLKIQNLKQRL